MDAASARTDSTTRERRRVDILSKEADGNENLPTGSHSLGTHIKPTIGSLEEPTTLDHRSFVQNVFGTVAFKMLEWLTPRNLELLTRVENKDLSSTGSRSTPDPLPALQHMERETFLGEAENGCLLPDAEGELKTDVEDDNSISERVATASSQRLSTSISKPVFTGDAKENEVSDPKFHNNSTAARPPNSHLRRNQESTDSPKGILNVPTSPRLREKLPDIVPVTRGFPPSKLQRRLSRQTLIKSPQMHGAEIKPNMVQLAPMEIKTAELVPESPKLEDSPGLDHHAAKEGIQNSVEQSPHRIESPRSASNQQVLLPQSLSHLSIEVIDFVCEILHSDGTCEKHVLQPRDVNAHHKRYNGRSAFLRRCKRPGHQPSSQNWRLFIEQSFFDVLGKPESLLRSFSTEENRLFDTQTIWYIMLRMTRVAPSLVFDSLWNVAGILFRPPEKLDVIYEWTNESRNSENLSSKALSTLDAAQVINICLHALVAAAPLVTDTRQLANMSRIRSYGLAMLGRESSALESATLCLHYEDAFTNELALRLARRVFAAIPVRQRFAGLLDFQKGIRKTERLEPDVLETILSSLKVLDPGTSSVLRFTDHERELHEKRVPTLILDWARTVMLQDWAGSAEVPIHGPFGGALATVAAICKYDLSFLCILC